MLAVVEQEFETAIKDVTKETADEMKNDGTQTVQIDDASSDEQRKLEEDVKTMFKEITDQMAFHGNLAERQYGSPAEPVTNGVNKKLTRELAQKLGQSVRTSIENCDLSNRQKGLLSEK